MPRIEDRLTAYGRALPPLGRVAAHARRTVCRAELTFGVRAGIAG